MTVRYTLYYPSGEWRPNREIEASPHYENLDSDTRKWLLNMLLESLTVRARSRF